MKMEILYFEVRQTSAKLEHQFLPYCQVKCTKPLVMEQVQSFVPGLMKGIWNEKYPCETSIEDAEKRKKII